MSITNTPSFDLSNATTNDLVELEAIIGAAQISSVNIAKHGPDIWDYLFDIARQVDNEMRRRGIAPDTTQASTVYNLACEHLDTRKDKLANLG